MCCLAYELDYYKALTREIPKVGSKITAFGAERRIEKVDIFQMGVILSDADGNIIEVPLENLREELRKQPGAVAQEPEEPPSGDETPPAEE
jgi:cell fate regulator YaaT (PSP1 superfamily)